MCMQNNWGGGKPQATGSPFPQSEPLPSSALWQPGVCESGFQATKEMGELKQGDTPHLWRLRPWKVIFKWRGNPREERAPLLGPLSQALAPHLSQKAPESGICNPSPTPCFPGTQSPKFSASHQLLSRRGPAEGRVGSGPRQAGCGAGSSEVNECFIKERRAAKFNSPIC